MFHFTVTEGHGAVNSLQVLSLSFAQVNIKTNDLNITMNDCARKGKKRIRAY